MSERLVIPDQVDVERELSVTHRWWTFSARFNVAVAQSVPVARLHKKETEGVMMRWGFVPPPATGNVTRLGSAHVWRDGIEKSEDYGSAWLHGQRCIVPLAGFYAWQRTQIGFRQPFFVRLVSRPVFGVAALWDRSVMDDDDVIESCALITVPANPLMAEIDNVRRQMPAILPHESYDSWLRSGAVKAKTLLQVFPREQMVAYPVSPYVNFVEYDDPRLAQAVR
jgi:putative SOS response-associated peptidase YedK